jgi:hypothetical protein
MISTKIIDINGHTHVIKCGHQQRMVLIKSVKSLFCKGLIPLRYMCQIILDFDCAVKYQK